MKKITAVMIVSALVTAIIAGCGGGAKEETFTREGLTITLNNRFRDDTGIEGTEAYTVAFTNDKDEIGILGLKEDFASLEAVGLSTGMSLNEYAQIIIDGNRRDSTVKTSEGITYFEFENSGYTYMAVVYKADNAFWLIQFVISTEGYGNAFADFITWAKSVEV